jgi:hypothetical protein
VQRTTANVSLRSCRNVYSILSFHSPMQCISGICKVHFTDRPAASYAFAKRMALLLFGCKHCGFCKQIVCTYYVCVWIWWKILKFSRKNFGSSHMHGSQ